ncbi:hypothetical protein LJC58_10325, partial [Lachnospiraceae bacterium OttesenSCG-928-D06]|nr:hypothetical protein [Lachnospiraceae bacterium OttesenSCG-928-D06]
MAYEISLNSNYLRGKDKGVEMNDSLKLVEKLIAFMENDVLRIEIFPCEEVLEIVKLQYTGFAENINYEILNNQYAEIMNHAVKIGSKELLISTLKIILSNYEIIQSLKTEQNKKIEQNKKREKRIEKVKENYQKISYRNPKLNMNAFKGRGVVYSV